jgi:hypothetical protein
VSSPAQPEIECYNLTVGQPVRITFRRPDNSWREVIWNVRYADERTAILQPVIGESYSTPKTRLFDADQVQFWDATALVAALEGLGS